MTPNPLVNVVCLRHGRRVCTRQAAWQGRYSADMQIPMSSLQDATAKLDAALRRLEAAIETVYDQAGDPTVIRREIEALTNDRGRLAEELDASLARESELQTLADEASAALGSAIEEVKAALKRTEQV